jgi:hypothetical protein
VEVAKKFFNGIYSIPNGQNILKKGKKLSKCWRITTKNVLPTNYETDQRKKRHKVAKIKGHSLIARTSK